MMNEWTAVLVCGAMVSVVAWAVALLRENGVLAANDFREDHPQFAAALLDAQSRFHLTPSESAAILAESVAP